MKKTIVILAIFIAGISCFATINNHVKQKLYTETECFGNEQSAQVFMGLRVGSLMTSGAIISYTNVDAANNNPGWSYCYTIQYYSFAPIPED